MMTTSKRLSCVLIVALGILLGIVAFAPPATAQVAASFTKDDCNQWNSGEFCSPPIECDEVTAPIFFPVQQPRTTPVGGWVQFVLRVQNDGDTETGLVLEELLPPCVDILCTGACVDTDCDGTPETGPVYIDFNGGGSSNPPQCNPGANSLTIDGITLNPDERMEVRFCGNYNTSGMCCNEAWIRDPGSPADDMIAVDAIDPAAPPELCVDVGGALIPFWKDDCGLDTGDPADCDDVIRGAGGERAIVPPAATKRVQWVLHLENPTQSMWTEFEFDDQLGPEYVVCCQPGDCTDIAWGCFEVIVDGTPRAPAGTCLAGPGGGINTIEAVPIGSTIEVRFCAELRGSEVEYCNNDAEIQSTTPPNFSRNPVDNLDGDENICILGDPPQVDVEGLKTVDNLTTGAFPAAVGDTVEYTYELCETSGNADIQVDFTDDIPPQITNPVITAGPSPPCQIVGQQLLCPGLLLQAGGDPCPNPTVITVEGTVNCQGLTGSDICNQGNIAVGPADIPTDDPNLPGDTDETCFAIELDDLSNSTKTVIPNDTDGNTVAGECGVDTLTYTINVVSDGSRDAVNVNVTDAIPANATFVAGSLAVDGMAQPDPVPPDTIVLGLGTVPTGTTVVVTYDVTTANTGSPYTICNDADLTSDDTAACLGMPITTPQACFDVPCGGGVCELDVIKTVTDRAGVPVTEAAQGTALMYSITFCNIGASDCVDVLFQDVLPECSVYDGETRLEGVAVVPDPLIPGPPQIIEFVATPLLAMGLCLTVEIDFTVSTDMGLCGPGTPVENTADVAGNLSDPSTAAYQVSDPVPADFCLLWDLNLITLDPLDPAKDPVPPTQWGAVMMWRGGCIEGGEPRLDPVADAIAGGPGGEWCEDDGDINVCIQNVGEWGVPGPPMQFFEVINKAPGPVYTQSCDPGALFIVRLDNNGDGFLDLCAFYPF